MNIDPNQIQMAPFGPVLNQDRSDRVCEASKVPLGSHKHTKTKNEKNAARQHPRADYTSFIEEMTRELTTKSIVVRGLT